MDPETRGVEAFGALGEGGCKWAGGVLVDGLIFCAPCESSTVLVIDPAARTTETFGDIEPLRDAGGAPLTGARSWKWCQGVAVDGTIFCPPVNATTVLAIHTRSRTLEFFELRDAAQFKYSQAVLMDT